MAQHTKTVFRGQKTLEEFRDQTTALLRQITGASNDEAESAAQAIASIIVTVWGGETIRVPQGTSGGRSSLLWFEMNERNIEIYNEYTGNNREYICKKYAIQKSRLYQILQEVRSNIIKKKAISTNNPTC